MQDHRVLLIHDGDWHWNTIEGELVRLPGVAELETGRSILSIIDHVDEFEPDIIIGKAVMGNSLLTSVITDLRTSLGYAGRIYILTDREIDRELSASFAWVGIDGLIPILDIPRQRFREFLAVLVSGQFRIGSIASSDGFLDVLRDHGMLPSMSSQISERQIRLLKLMYHSPHNPTLDELAAELAVAKSTVKRDFEQLFFEFGVGNRLALGAEAVRRGLLP